MGKTKTTAAPRRRPQATAATVALPGDLGIEHAAALKSLLLPVATCAGTVTLDGGAVTRLHAAPLQLLVSFCRDRRDAGLGTGWARPAPALRDAAAALGLTDLLDLYPEHP